MLRNLQKCHKCGEIPLMLVKIVYFSVLFPEIASNSHCLIKRIQFIVLVLSSLHCVLKVFVVSSYPVMFMFVKILKEETKRRIIQSFLPSATIT